MDRSQLLSDLIRHVHQPSDVLRSFLGEALWKKAAAACGEPQPRWLFRDKQAWRERIQEFLTREDSLLELAGAVETRREKAEKMADAQRRAFAQSETPARSVKSPRSAKGRAALEGAR